MSKSNKITGYLLLTFIFPLLGVFSSIKNLNWSQRKWVLIIFVTLYGSLIPLSGGSDGVRLQQYAYEYVGMNFNDFITILKHIITLNPVPYYPTDIYVHVVYYFVSSILGLPGLFFVVVSFVFGYFYISGLYKVLNWNKNKHKTLISLIFILLFIILRGVDTMQSVRTWTGMWVLFNGVFGYFSTKEKKYLWLIMSVTLFHFAFLIIVMPAFIVLFLNKLSPKVFIIIYSLSFIISFNPGGILNSIEKNELGKRKVQGYYNEEYDPVLNRISQEDNVWYAKYGKADAVYLGGNAIAVLLIIGGFYSKRMTTLEATLFTVGLMMASMANFGDFIWTFYSRTMANAVLYFLATIVLITTRGGIYGKNRPNSLSMKFSLWICILIFVPKIVYTLSNTLIYTSMYIFGLPMLGWLLPDTNVSLREIIGWVI